MNRFPLQLTGMLLLLMLIASCSAEEETATPPMKNASVLAVLQDDHVVPGGALHYNMTLTNHGGEKSYDVAVEHRIFSTPLGRVVKTEGEIVKLETWVYKDKAITIPADAPTGDYQLIVAITYSANGTAESGGFFSVVAPIQEVNKSESSKPDLEPSSQPKNSSQQTSSSSGSSSPTGAATTAPAPSPSPANSLAQTPPPAPSPPKEVTVEHKDREFVPAKITIEPGTTVVWIQRDKTSAVVDGPGFHSEPLGPGKEFRHTFQKVGIFDYYSQLTKASGSVVVEDPDHPITQKHDPYSFKGGLNS